jgi:hypothetical protein
MSRTDFIIQRFKKIIQKTNILFLLPIPPLIGMSLLLIGAFVGQKLYPEGVPRFYSAVFGCSASFMFGLTGFITIYRREMPGPFGYKIRGKYPVITGVLAIIVFWGLGILGLVAAILGK